MFGHKDADGDTLGCSLAFADALRGEGKDVWVLVPPPLPEMYAFLPGFEQILAEPPHGVDPQLVFFFDSGNLERSGSAVRRIASHATIINVDHHQSNTRFGDINIIDADASAVGQMVMEMLDAFGYPLTPDIATNLYVALLTDTGGFRHENTTPRALEDAARLARLGADPGLIATQVYKMRPETTLKLSGLALATMRVELDGRLAWAKVTRRMLREANAVMAESEGIIDTLNSIAGLELAIMFKEVTGELTKISVRSRGAVDAAALCATFGGGGHIRAAGAEIERSMDEAVRLVLAAAKEAILAASSER
ncbi:MAG TPA: bifunctional oligoribonuclease/PAP phosphatase NrnA [Candidatus Dormibacteraeota bacterium]|nr:bifunctional oligoribonuclease/PAP phosphatase NrnA [Candidatus Dormibacteraeota bacterium]HEX2680789.1 bifunctional oligoribonuclease/PAP phosphatase NrnA [Candidatus Dormibacteraeota bacterium]